MLRRRSVFRPVSLSQSRSESPFESVWARRALFAVVMIGVLSRAWHPLGGGDDVWAHAFVGRWMWEHGEVASRTLGLWGRAPQTWIAHSWGAQMAFFGTLQGGGAMALVFLGMVMSALPFALLWRFWTTQGKIGLLAPPLFALAVWVSAPRFRTRPELFSALFLTLLLWFLSTWPAKSRRQLLWLPVLFCVWANFHGGVAMGLLLLAATLVGDALQGAIEKRRMRVQWLGLAGVGSVLAVLVNPYGLAYLSALAPVRGPMFAAIDEWKPFWKWPPLPSEYVFWEAVLWGVALAAWIMNPRRRWAHVGWLLIVGALFVMSRRHLWLLALTDLCVLASCAPVLEDESLRGNFARFGRSTFAPLVRWFDNRSWRGPFGRFEPAPHAGRQLIGACVVLGMGGWLSQSLPKREAWPRPVFQPGLPREAARKIKRLRPRRLFNDYEHSSYLQWALRGQPRLYIDLLNAYPDQLMLDYLDMSVANERGQQLFRDLRPDVVYVRPHDAKSGLADLTRWLDNNTAYRRVYNQSDGAIWQREKFVE